MKKTIILNKSKNPTYVRSKWGAVMIVAVLFASCKPDNLKEGAQKEYFDVKGYFENTVTQLNKRHKAINKTVVHNGTTERKTVEISDWKAELALFTASDINKPAWSGSYEKRDSLDATIYTATDPDLKTHSIAINKTKSGAIKQITIYNEVNNALYNTRENLTYFPDSLYVIDKYQKVVLLGANSYKISGRLK